MNGQTPAPDLTEFERLVEGYREAITLAAKCLAGEDVCPGHGQIAARSLLLAWARATHEKMEQYAKEAEEEIRKSAHVVVERDAAHDKGRRQGLQAALAAAEQAGADGEWPTDAVRALAEGAAKGSNEEA